MRRISIRTLMVLIAGSAVGLAALRNANEVWARVMMMLVVGLVCVAGLRAILLRGRERAWWLGFAVLGCTYLCASLSPLRSRLSTTHLLEYVHARVVSSSIATFDVSRADQDSLLFRIVMIDGTANSRTVSNSVYHSTPGEDILATMEPANRWRSALPGAANRDPFLRIGHSLFALLIGMVGGTVAAWFWGRRERPGQSPERGGRTFLKR
jgi:hypothetical protein